MTITFKELLEDRGNLSMIPELLLKSMNQMFKIYGRNSEVIPFTYTKKTGFSNFFSKKKIDADSNMVVFCKTEKKSYIISKSYQDFDILIYNTQDNKVYTEYEASKSRVNRLVNSGECYFIMEDKNRIAKREKRRETELVQDKDFTNVMVRKDFENINVDTYRFGDKIKAYIEEKKQKYQKELQQNQQVLAKQMYKLIRAESREDFTINYTYNRKILSKMNYLKQFSPETIRTKQEYIEAKRNIDANF